MQQSISRFSLLALGLIAFLGCARREDPEPKPLAPITSAKKAVTKDPLKGASYDGVIRGKVTLAGEAPVIQLIGAMEGHADKACCLTGAKDAEKKQQTWILGEGNTVANVVIALKAPAGKYFWIRDEDKDRSADKFNRVIDQPHCAFIPHIQVTFCKYFDGKDYKASGERLIVKNSAMCNHNTSWAGDPTKSGGGNRTLKSGEELDIELVPESAPIGIKCDIHPWMNARIWAFDHPYIARTDADGVFEIRNVPTEVEIGLTAWHESPGFFHGGKDGTKIKLQRGETKEVDLKVPVK